MAFPSGVQTVTVVCSPPVSWTGQAASLEASITATSTLVHAPSGTPVVAFTEIRSGDPLTPVSIDLPITDQAGFVDPSGAAFINWAYILRGKWILNGEQISFVKSFQLPTGTVGPVDLDLVPDGPVTTPVTAPTAAVLTVDGQTGNVTLDTTYVGKGELFLNPRDYGAVGDGVTEDTDAFQDLADLGGSVFVPSGTYVIRSVSITKDLRLLCEDGVIFRRPANADTTQGSYWSTANIAMFAVDKTGVNLEFTNFTFDGNNANQPAVTPFGLFLKCLPIGTISGKATNLTINKGSFINGTSGYMVLRGDDVQRRYETNVYMNDCRFHETLTGIGMGDPASPNSLGYGPTYVLVLDFVRLVTENFYADWTKDVSTTGKYSVCAINLSYFGGSTANSGESSLYMHGTTHLKNLGRATKDWNNDATFGNNAIGVIDAYGNAETLYIESVKAEGSKFVTIRSKASLKYFTVKAATLTDCNRGLQVSPSSTGAAETVVSVSNVTTSGGVVPAVEAIGTTATDRLKAVHISNVYTKDIGETAETASGGAVIVKNAYQASLEAIVIDGAPYKGIQITDVAYVWVNSINIINVGTEAIDNSNAADVCKQIQLTDFHFENCGGNAIKVNNGLKKLFISDGYIVNSVNYGLFVNTSLAEVFVSSVSVDTVTGTSRAFYVLNGECTFIGNRVLNTTTPLFTGTTARRREQHNSWNPAEYQGTAAPTTGTWSVGDKVHNTSPAAGGTVGWVCVTAGTPGTWKTFGTIAA